MTSACRVEFLGDSAIRVVAHADDGLIANDGVHWLARRVRAAGLPGVRDVVPGMRDLVIHVGEVCHDQPRGAPRTASLVHERG